jgi:hypothetical protein
LGIARGREQARFLFVIAFSTQQFDIRRRSGAAKRTRNNVIELEVLGGAAMAASAAIAFPNE